MEQKKNDAVIVPKSTELEGAVIGEILYEPELLKNHEIESTLFTKYGPIYEAIKKAWAERGSVDLVILQEYLPQEQIVKISERISAVLSIENFPAHLEQLQEYHKKRNLYALCYSTLIDIHDRTYKDLIIPIKEFQEQQTDTAFIATIKKAVMSADEIREINFPIRAKIVNPFLDESSILMIAGWRGVGKSLFSMGLLEAITQGEKFGPWEIIKPVACLMLDGEMVITDIKKRLIGQRPEQGEPRKEPFLIYNDHWANQMNLPKANLLNPIFRGALMEICRNYQIKVLVLDNVSSLTPGIDENSKAEWDPINQWLLEMRYLGVSSILIHHLGKSGQQRGTSGREDNLDVSIELKQPADYQREDGARFLVNFSKSRIPTEDLSLLGECEFQLKGTEWIWGFTKKKRQEEILELLGQKVPVAEIATTLNIDKSYVYRVKRNKENP